MSWIDDNLPYLNGSAIKPAENLTNSTPNPSQPFAFNDPYAGKSWLWRAFHGSEIERAYNEQLMNYNNAYNSESAVKDRLEEAGYNTNLAAAPSQSPSEYVDAGYSGSESAALEQGSNIAMETINGLSSIQGMIQAAKKLPHDIRNIDSNSAAVEEATNQMITYGRREAAAAAETAETNAQIAKLGLSKARFEDMSYAAAIAARSVIGDPHAQENAERELKGFFTEAKETFNLESADRSLQQGRNMNEAIRQVLEETQYCLEQATADYIAEIKAWKGTVDAQVAANTLAQVSSRYQTKIAQYWSNDFDTHGAPPEVRNDAMLRIMNGINESRMPEWAKVVCIAILQGAGNFAGAATSAAGAGFGAYVSPQRVNVTTAHTPYGTSQYVTRRHW